MIFEETKLKGAYIIKPEPQEDERGFFARTYCCREFNEHGLDFNIVQCNISLNKKKGTLRGMHYQASPHNEAKLVSCINGNIFDVIIDLRLNSPTYSHWFSVELSEANHLLLYIPVGFAHGFQTLSDNSVVYYQMSEYYHPECASGVKWDDPVFNIKWPIEDCVIATKDRQFPDFIK